MLTTLTETQKIYEIYRLLDHSEGVYTTIEQQAEANLFSALNRYYGPENPDINAPNQVVVESNLGVTLLVFYYKVSDIFNAVFERTSYIAKTRRDKETKSHLLDVIALTQDDATIFEPFLSDASSALFADALHAFSRQVSGAYLNQHVSGIASVETKTYVKGDKVLHDGKVYRLLADTENTDVSNGFDNADWEEISAMYYTDDKIEFVLMRPDWFNMNMATVADRSILEAVIAYIMSRWFTHVFPEEADVYMSLYDKYRRATTSNINATNRPLQRRYRQF